MKKLLITLIAMTLCVSVSAQENKEVTRRLEEKYGFACYHSTDGGWYSIRQNGKEGACDLTGKEVIPPIWDDIHKGEDYYKVTKDGKVGIRDFNNNELLAPKYTEVYWYQKNDHNGFCEVKMNDKVGVIDRNNKEVIPLGKYEGVYPYDLKEQSYCQVKRDGKMGVYDIRTSKEVLPCKYDKVQSWMLKEISYLNKDISQCVVSQKEKEGVYDIAKNKEIIPCQYVGIYPVSKDLWYFNVGGYREDFKIKGGKWGFVDANGKEIIPAQYDDVVAQDGIIQVSKDGVTSILPNPLDGTNGQFASGQKAGTVDTNIPQGGNADDNLFAFIFATENYANLSGADYAANDGKVFAEYCKKTIGVPENNVRYYEDATFGNMVGAMKKIKDIAEVYDGEAKIIVYFAGLGATDAKTRERYLLPADASLTTLASTGYSLSDLQQTLGDMNTAYTMVIVDAPFNNTDRNGKQLASHRGVQITPKAQPTTGNVILCTAAKDGETAFASADYGHGLFTYALLQELQTTKGKSTMKGWMQNSASWTGKEVLKWNGKTQAPQVRVSPKVENKWSNLKF